MRCSVKDQKMQSGKDPKAMKDMKKKEEEKEREKKGMPGAKPASTGPTKR